MSRFFATCAKGTEGVLIDEMRALRLPRVKGSRGGVHFEGQLVDGMRACLGSRLALRILMLLGEGEARGAEGLYQKAFELPWEEHLDLLHRIAVDATVRSSELTHSHYVALRTKDAICDRLRERLGGRPDVDPKDPDVLVRVHLARDHLQVYLDLSGTSLHQRGWRTEAHEAPLRETLAAAVLALGHYDPSRPFCDPMCGSGTLPIEAALIARRIAPGLGRSLEPDGFAFQRWPGFGDAEKKALADLQEEMKAVILPRAPAPILGRDLSRAALTLCRRNAGRAGVAGDIHFEERDARRLWPLPAGCQLFVNPPYGERIGGAPEALRSLYCDLGAAYAELLDRAPRAAEAPHPLTVLSGSTDFEPSFGARASSWHGLYNGPLEVSLLRFGIGDAPGPTRGPPRPARPGAPHAPSSATTSATVPPPSPRPSGARPLRRGPAGPNKPRPRR